MAPHTPRTSVTSPAVRGQSKSRSVSTAKRPIPVFYVRQTGQARQCALLSCELGLRTNRDFAFSFIQNEIAHEENVTKALVPGPSVEKHPMVGSAPSSVQRCQASANREPPTSWCVPEFTHSLRNVHCRTSRNLLSSHTRAPQVLLRRSVLSLASPARELLFSGTCIGTFQLCMECGPLKCEHLPRSCPSPRDVDSPG